ncbi:hypothetical protein MACJ_000032 [Theileria orientalis]|uniref:Uncharacterized protein n=1 Tax=Theileria orientalis TaxID=68886 RepID=A0A976QPK4_THEOR|nr:hypothetical protein MACJ_000032 [Theileria orientalis]
MGPKGKWIFKCLGCKTKDEDDTEYVDLSKIRDVEEIIHINDLVVSKPDLYVERPNIVYIEKKQLSDDGRSFAEIKPTIAIPIENKWPSDISSNDSIIETQKKIERKMKQKRKIVPLSNVPGLLSREYKNQHLTISESIAIAENIYQNERRQMMNLGKDDEKIKPFQYLEGDRLNLNEYQRVCWSKNKVEEYTFSDDESTRGTISRSRNKINEYQEDQLTHICYMSEYSEEEESLTEKIWNMFLSASKLLSTEENKTTHKDAEKLVRIEKETEKEKEQKGPTKSELEKEEWIGSNYKITQREASEIVEGTIKNIIETNN